MNSRYLLILLIFQITHSAEFWDYTTSTTMTCNIISSYSETDFWNATRLHALDRYSLLALSPLLLILLALIILSYRIPHSKSQPSDIIMGLGVSQIISIATSFCLAIYSQANSSASVPQGFMSFCNTVLVFNVVGWLGISIYNILFCIVLSYTVRNTLQSSLLSKAKYHCFAIFLIIAGTIGVYFSNYAGKGENGKIENGTCGIKYSSNAPFIRLFVTLCLVTVAMISIYRFKTGIPKNQFFQKQSIYKYYYVYVFSIVIIQVMSEVLGLVGILNCYQLVPNPALGISYSIGDILQLMNPIFLALLRFNHPAVKNKIKSMFKKRQNSIQLITDPLAQEDQQQYNWLGSLLESIRGSQVYSFLVGMLISYIDNKQEVIRSIKDVDFTSKYSFQINEHTADNYISKKFNSKEGTRIKAQLGGIKPLDFQVTYYCPRVFKYYLQDAGLDLQTSLSFIFNSNTIMEVAHIEGGKSGQFFFFSHDYNLLFKTISHQQAELYLRNIKKFVNHYNTEEYSLISNIIGLYKFKRLDIQDQDIYIILQKNISACERVNVERVYDLKGSKYHRETLADKSIVDISSVILKDIDFIKLQKKVVISEISSKNIKRILRSDINFLKSLGVMDYSLLILKVNWSQAAFYKQKSIDELIPHVLNPFVMIPSEVENGVYYHFGVIDYLQTWTIAKQTQRFFKQVITREFSNAVITAEEPTTYAYRLQKFIQTIF